MRYDPDDALSCARSLEAQVMRVADQNRAGVATEATINDLVRELRTRFNDVHAPHFVWRMWASRLMRSHSDVPTALGHATEPPEDLLALFRTRFMPDTQELHALQEQRDSIGIALGALRAQIRMVKEEIESKKKQLECLEQLEMSVICTSRITTAALESAESQRLAEEVPDQVDFEHQ